MLEKTLYRTNLSIRTACENLGIPLEENNLENLSQCTHCGIWWYTHELILDLDDNDLCKFCTEYYGK
jgi:hypothetical protein